jgi:hypothetical protein
MPAASEAADSHRFHQPLLTTLGSARQCRRLERRRLGHCQAATRGVAACAAAEAGRRSEQRYGEDF